MLTFTKSRHAYGRAAQRHITDEEISDALNRPERTESEGNSGRLKYIGRPLADGNRVIVVATHPPRNNSVRIVTCYARSGRV